MCARSRLRLQINTTCAGLATLHGCHASVHGLQMAALLVAGASMACLAYGCMQCECCTRGVQDCDICSAVATTLVNSVQRRKSDPPSTSGSSVTLAAGCTCREGARLKQGDRHERRRRHAVVHMHTNLIIPDEVTAGGHGVGADWVSQLHTNANKWEAHTRAELGTEELHRRKRRLWVTHDWCQQCCSHEVHHCFHSHVASFLRCKFP